MVKKQVKQKPNTQQKIRLANEVVDHGVESSLEDNNDKLVLPHHSIEVGMLRSVLCSDAPFELR